MKRIFLLFILGFSLLSQTGYAQEKIERFCVIRADNRIDSYAAFRKLRIDYGQGDAGSGFKDTIETIKLEAAKKCKSEASLMNYMLSIGWAWVSTREPYGKDAVVLVFKKSFSPQELTFTEVK